MSQTMRFTARDAIKYNARAKDRLSLADTLPSALFIDYPIYELGQTEHDVELIKAFQKDHNLAPDGKLGPATYAKILSVYDHVDDDDMYWRKGVQRIKCGDVAFKLTCYDQKGGRDLHAVGWFTPKWFVDRPAPKQLVIHWGGLNPKHLYDCFSGARKVSSHVAIGLENGECVAYQMLDFTHRAWHAGASNGRSIGIDICQQADKRWHKHYESNHYDVHEMVNESGRGPQTCLSLDPRIASGVASLINELCEVLGIPKETPDHNAVLDNSAKFSGVIGHHHVHPGKWDCAPWWEEIADLAGLERVVCSRYVPEDDD